MKKRIKQSKEERKKIIEAKIKRLDIYLTRQIEEWAEHNRKLDSNVRLLTKDTILKLIPLMRKYYSKESKTEAERTLKKEIHQALRNAFYDIERMARLEFIGKDSLYKPETWRKDFPSYVVGNLIECLVELFGEDYAIPLCDSIRRGLEKHEEWAKSVSIEVPIIKRTRTGL